MSQFLQKLRRFATKTVRPQLRLSTLFMAILACGIVLAWWLDHQRQVQEIARLQYAISQQEATEIAKAKARVSEFVDKHRGRLLLSEGSMTLDLHNTFVGNTQLNQIRDHLKQIDERKYNRRIPLLLYGTRVTKTFADELQSELPNWVIVFTPPEGDPK
jgi:hypothetical protein